MAEWTASSPDRPLALVGMMGAGKSSVGARVARRLDRRFIDLDDEIERRTNRTIAEFFASEGEAEFRRIEHDMLAEVLATAEPIVLATGGGVVTGEENRRLLHELTTVIWLRASAGVLVHRLADDGSRPLLGADSRGNLERLIAERDPLYQDLADHVVDVDRVDRRVVATNVLRAVGTEEVSVP